MEKIIWNFLLNKLNNPYGVSALMGNLYVESHLNSMLLESSKARKLGMTNQEYTSSVDNGTYDNFIHDDAGYGLVQWTHWSRKEKLYNFAKERGSSIGDIHMQLDYMWQELQGYKTVLQALYSATNIREASDVVAKRYEKPEHQEEKYLQNRADYGQKYFDTYAEVGMNTWKQVSAMLDGWKRQNLAPYEIVVNLANACIGWAYVFGARGEQCTPVNRRSFYTRKKKETIKTKCKNYNGDKSCSGCQWYPSGITLFYDCRGFTYWLFLKGAGISISGAGATTQYDNDSNWEEKGLIANMPKDKVCCVFRYDSSTKKMEHTLLYDGKGNYIHCSGTVKKCAKSKYSATHYAIPKGLYGGGDQPIMGTAKVHADSGSTVNMRSKPATSGSILKTVPVGATVDVISKDTTWSNVQYGGTKGYMMNKFLTFDEPTDTVTVKKADLEKVYSMIGDMLKG